MNYGSVCSGIEAATVAWHPLGWKPAFFAEIEPFPRAVLAHHYPDVPCHGDFTTIEADQYGPIDLLVGGTPCQSFSIAGLRGGLDDDRGSLALEFLRLADRKRPKWLVWENVPGVLSSNGGRDFGAILGGMVELGYGIAYRVLDAQYFGVPQRRRRVFVVGCLGDWRSAASVLFERKSLSGDSPPRREKGQVAPTVPSRSTGGGGLGTDFDCDGGLIQHNWPADIAPTLNAAFGSKLGLDDQHIRAGAPLFVPGIAHALRGEGFDASEDGTGRGTPLGPVAINENQQGAVWASDTFQALNKGGGKPGQGYPAIAYAIQERAVSENPDAGPAGAGFRGDGAAYTLEAWTVPQAVAYSIMPMNSGKDYKARETDVAQPIMAGGPVGGNQGGDFVRQASTVRRLTPRECERLQGFPDDYTLIPWRKKPAELCPDGPRYKALGNSMAVPVMRWIGERIAMVEKLTTHHRDAA